jgi:penicillin-binding protein 1A
VLMGKYFKENRTPVAYNALPQNLIDALIATEDVRFESHSGIDFKGLLAVGYYGITGRRRGSSTLTQKVAKNLYRTRAETNRQGLLTGLPGLGMLIIKTKEWITAIRLERAYSKKEILEMYLNTVEFGSNSYGIKSAAKTFFSKEPRDLKLEEAALLVGMVNNPSRFSPISNKARAQKRRDWVLSQMHKYKFIEDTTYHHALVRDIRLKFLVENQNNGIAPYLRAEAGKWLLKWSRENGHDLYSDGLKIYTTIDARMQQYAEESVQQHMKVMQKHFFAYWKDRGKPWTNEKGKVIPGFLENAIKRTERYIRLNHRFEGNKDSINYYLHKKVPMKVFTLEAPGEKDVVMSPMDSLAYYKYFLHTGFIAMNPLNGNIRAWVGGTNYKYFKYDHVKQGRRQPGSTFKPVVYTAAIENGYSPCYEVMDVPVTFPAEGGRRAYTPTNAEGYTGRKFTLQEGLAYSQNTITAYLVKKLSPEVVVDYARRLGLTSVIDPVPAVGFGSSVVSVYEMAGAYSTFVNKGTWTEPVYITRIEDKKGNVLYTNVPQSREVLSEQTAYLMIHMLRGAADIKLATAWYGLRRLYNLKNEIGAKTGTTTNHADAWFMGVTPNLVCGMWVGGEDRSIHFQSANYGQGNKLAMPIYGIFMNKVYADKSLNVSQAPFPKPEKPLTVELDCSKYYNNGFSDTVRQEQILQMPANPAEGEGF